MNKYQYKVQGVDYDVEIEEVEGNVAKVVVNRSPLLVHQWHLQLPLPLPLPLQLLVQAHLSRLRFLAPSLN